MQAGDLWLVGVVHLNEEARKKYTMAELRNLAVPEWVPIPDIPRMVGKTRRQYAANFETPIEPPDIFRANDQGRATSGRKKDHENRNDSIASRGLPAPPCSATLDHRSKRIRRT